MSMIAIGDIHGNPEALDDLLHRMAREIALKDTVAFLGDDIDRGTDSTGCIQRFIEFRCSAKGCVVTLLGHHEQWLLRTFVDHSCHSWLCGMEAFQTIQSYSSRAAVRLRTEAEAAGLQLVTQRFRLPCEVFFHAVPEEHMTFLNGLQTFCRFADAVCVHDGLDPDAGPVEEQISEDLI